MGKVILTANGFANNKTTGTVGTEGLAEALKHHGVSSIAHIGLAETGYKLPTTLRSGF